MHTFEKKISSTFYMILYANWTIFYICKFSFKLLIMKINIKY